MEAPVCSPSGNLRRSMSPSQRDIYNPSTGMSSAYVASGFYLLHPLKTRTDVAASRPRVSESCPGYTPHPRAPAWHYSVLFCLSHWQGYDMPDVQEAAEQATFWVSFGQAAGLVGVTAAATAVGAFIVTKTFDSVDPALYDDMDESAGQRRTRLSMEEAQQLEQQQQQQPEQQPQQQKK